MKKYKYEILLAILVASLLLGTGLWFSLTDDVDLKMVAIGVLILLIGLIYAYKALKRARDKSAGLTVDDEFTKLVKLHAGGKAFQLSMYLWLVIMYAADFFEEKIEMIGAGILGSALIYAFAWMYYKNTANFDEK